MGGTHWFTHLMHVYTLYKWFCAILEHNALVYTHTAYTYTQGNMVMHCDLHAAAQRDKILFSI